MKQLLPLKRAKRFLLLLLSAGAMATAARAVPVTITYDFTFDQNAVALSEVPVTGSVTVTLNTPAPAFAGYTLDGIVDSLEFNVPGLPGLQPADTNYVKMLFNNGSLTYLLVSDRSDFILSAIPPRTVGYVLAIQADDLLTATGIKAGSSSRFMYRLQHRPYVDLANTFSSANILKVANPVPSVPDTAGTFSLITAAMLALAGFRRRFAV